jgi:hypothetical protein
MSSSIRYVSDVHLEIAKAIQDKDTIRLEEIGDIVNDMLFDTDVKESIAVMIEAVTNLIEDSGDEEG